MPALLPIKPYLTAFCYRLLHPELPAPTPLIRSFIKAHLLPSHSHLSGFNHFELESSDAGRLVHWYNVQFYCGWGDAGDERLYEGMVASGWNPRKLVLGVVTNPDNGSGHVDLERLGKCIAKLKAKHGNDFGGVMGWEYFNAGGNGKPDEWVRSIAGMLGRNVISSGSMVSATTGSAAPVSSAGPVPIPSDTEDVQIAMQDASLLGEQAASSTALASSTATASHSSTTDGASVAPAGNDAKVQRLVEMGFDRAEAVAALEAMGGDVDAAAGILFGE
jgi:hypothetical protein